MSSTSSTSSTLRAVASGLVASALATQVKTIAESRLQPVAEKIFPPRPAEKAELGADPAGHPESMPPSELADRAQHVVTGRELSDEQRQQVAAPLHWAMGVGAGVAYAVVAERRPVVRVGAGSVFGLLLFGATHASTLPAAGLQHPVQQMPRAWWVWEAGSHVIYALTVDAVLRVLDRIGR